MNNWGNFLLVLSLIPAIGFPILYGLTAKFWRSALGWALMYSSLTMLILYGLGGLNLWLGEDYPGKAILRPVMLFMAFTFMWVQSISYLVTWLRKRRARKEQERQE